MPLGRSEVEHLLRRVGFGATAAETAHFVGRELPDILDEMFAKQPPTASMPPSVTDRLWYRSRIGLSDWWIDRMADAGWLGGADRPSPLIEKLALFWHSHFACGTGKVADFRSLWRQLRTYHESGTGDFEALTRAVMADGGMLVYFDNFSNSKRRPQENLARELMELHTIGVGNFTERDVIEMARAWTGHGVTTPFGLRPDHTYRFRRDDHDTGTKVLFGLRPRNWDGPDTIRELVNGVKQRDTARFVATKIWRYYADAEPTPQIVDDLADAFIAGGMNVERLLRAVFTHPGFWAPATRWSMVRQPVEWAADILRRFEISAADSHITSTARYMGQNLFSPPNVAGWGTGRYWVSTTAVWGKARFLRSIRDHANIERTFRGIEDGTRAQAADRIFEAFGVTEPTDQSRARIGQWFDDIVADMPWGASRDAVYMGGLLPEVQIG